MLAGLDALARSLIVRASPVRFDLAISGSDQRAVFRLRCETVLEEGWASPTDYPDGVERDESDDVAVHIVGLEKGSLVACARLVFPRAGRQLPTEKDFELSVRPAGAVVDIGRAIVSKEFRSAEHTLFGALLARCWLEVRLRGYHDLCGAATAARLERYRQFGLPLRLLGPPRPYWGAERYPVFLDGLEFARFAWAMVAAHV
jgi:predicted GNAT family N-acyltransferase